MNAAEFLDALRVRRFVADSEAGSWITPAQRRAAYEAGDHLARLFGADAPMTADDLAALGSAYERRAA